MKILGFQGLRYSASAHPDEQGAPPFDQIDDTLRRQLQRQSEYHFSHLTRPDPETEDPHQHARDLHAEWLERGVVSRDQTPSLYPYRIELADGSLRRGLFALVGVGPSSSGDLRPHEQTVDKPLADRLALLEATRVDLEPVMLMAEDQDGAFEAMLAEDCGGEPTENKKGSEELVRYEDPSSGDQHVLFRLSDPRRVASYQQLLASRQAVIADGHHRTKVAQLFAKKHRPAEGSAASAKMAVLLSLASKDVVIDPIHRALMIDVDASAMRAVTVERVPFSGTTGREFAAAVALQDRPAVGVRFAGEAPEIWILDPLNVPDGTPGAKAALPAILLQYQLLAAVGLDLTNASDGTLVYRSDSDDLWTDVERGEAKAGFWLPPMTPESFALATVDGDVMPPKSTRFMPKLASGLVWSSHDGETVG